MNKREPFTIGREPADKDESEVQPSQFVSPPWLFTYGLVALQLVTIPFAFTSGSYPIVFVFVAANLSLAAVVPIWWVVIRHWAVIAIGLLVVLGEGMVLITASPGGSLMLFLLPILIGATVAIPLVGISCFWGRFDKPKVDDGQMQFHEGLKFSIYHLFIASAVVAVICGLGKAIVPHLVLQASEHLYVVIAIVISFNTLMSVWALMGQSMGLRIVISSLFAVLTCVGSGWGYVELAQPRIQCLFGLCWLATTVHLALLRRSGVRFIKK